MITLEKQLKAGGQEFYQYVVSVLIKSSDSDILQLPETNNPHQPQLRHLPARHRTTWVRLRDDISTGTRLEQNKYIHERMAKDCSAATWTPLSSCGYTWTSLSSGKICSNPMIWLQKHVIRCPSCSARTFQPLWSCWWWVLCCRCISFAGLVEHDVSVRKE